MLVLSRHSDQAVVFPNLDITVHVLKVRGKTVKLGIQAPPEIGIQRSESAGLDPLTVSRLQARVSFDRHTLRNRLSAINLGLHLLQKQNEAGMLDQAEATLQRLLQELKRLDDEVKPRGPETEPVRSHRALNLLVIEDDDNERHLLAGLLRMHGFSVETAADGVEALDLLATGQIPDFVLVDMKMPRIDGPATIEHIRRDARLATAKVFAVSGTDPSCCGVTGGYDAWFPKPLDPQRLINAMTATVRA